MTEHAPAPTDAAPAPSFVDDAGHVLPVSKLPRGVLAAFKKLLYAKAPLFVRMKALLRHEMDKEMTGVVRCPSCALFGEPAAIDAHVAAEHAWYKPT